MRVLFLEDQLPTARAGDIRNVKTGFARNYLIPRGIAVLATEHQLRRAEKLRAEAEARRLRELSEWRDIAAELAENPVDLIVRTGPTGRLYGSVTSTMIAARLSELTGRTIERKRIRLPEQIRMVGTYRLPVRFMGEVDATVTLNVVSDDVVDTEDEASTVDPHAITDEILARGEIDMHGWEEPQAVDALALIAGRILARNIAQFRVIHGKGEGTLRQAVRDRLNQMKTEGTVIIWGPGRTDGDTDADSLEAVSWFTVS
jgi:large subunit ribosomal protein L9